MLGAARKGAIVWFLSALSCGGRSSRPPPERLRSEEELEISREIQKREMGRPTWLPPSLTASRQGFAWTPITDLGTAVASVLTDAARGEEFNTKAVPVTPSEAGEERVVYQNGSTAPPEDARNLAFIIRCTSELAKPNQDDGSIFWVYQIHLARRGWKLLRLEIQEKGNAVVPSLPRALQGIERLTADILKAAREGRLESMFAKASDVAYLSKDGKRRLELPDEHTVLRLAEAAQSLEVVRYAVDEVALVLQSETHLYTLSSKFTFTERWGWMLSSNPLVEVSSEPIER
jgi:hypothetical protein